MYFLTNKRRIIQTGLDFKQVDQEWDWDNFLILHAFVGALGCYIFPISTHLPLWGFKGFITALAVHVVFSEPLYYCLHRKLHGECG